MSVVHSITQEQRDSTTPVIGVGDWLSNGVHCPCRSDKLHYSRVKSIGGSTVTFVGAEKHNRNPRGDRRVLLNKHL